MFMEIRDARPGEEEMIIEEFWKALALRMERYSELNVLDESASDKSYDPMLERIEDDKYRVLILEEDGPKAYMMLEEEISMTREKGRCVKIADLYVKEGWRGQGLGTAMIKKAREHAENRDFDYLKVASEWENEEARVFYRKKGFKPKKVQYVDKID
jgi:GNAT superfamily N-acetyltransferase